jgi:tetratricopeptide (TPR) repeat protein
LKDIFNFISKHLDKPLCLFDFQCLISFFCTLLLKRQILMAKKNNVKDAQVAEDEVIYEDEEGEGNGGASGGASGLLKNRGFLIGAGTVIILVIAAIFFMKGRTPTFNAEASDAMRSAVDAFQADSMVASINGRQTDAATQGFEGFSDLVSTYSGTAQGNLAKYYLGMAYLQTGNTDEAIEYLESFKKANDMVSAAAYAGLGAAYEEKGEFGTAAGFYEKAARTPGENSLTTPYYLMHAARNYESAGNPDAALKLYKDIKRKYPVSEEGQGVDRYIGKLDGGNGLE